MDETEQRNGMTVAEAIKLVMPQGTNGSIGGNDATHRVVPQYAPDLFAVCGYIIEHSGLIGHYIPQE